MKGFLRRQVKQISRTGAVRGFVCWLAAQYIRLCWITGRWDVVGAEPANDLWDQDKGFILAFWHGRIAMMPKSWRDGVPIGMLISNHADGELIARTIGHFGLGTIRGSTAKPGKTDKGGMAALRQMLKTLKAGGCVGITPDGPRGPRMRASDGAIAVARMSGAPILPAAFATSRGKILGSWDSFLLPLPFSRGVIMWGEAISVARDADEAALADARLAVENGLIKVTQDADRHVGRVPVEPADPVSPAIP